jgi:Mrr N-terminal domain
MKKGTKLIKTDHRQTIESAWDALLTAIAEAAADAKAGKSTKGQAELLARLDTLQASVRGLGNAWLTVKDLLPAEADPSAADSEAPGALPEKAYYKPLAKALLSLGGSAKTCDAIQAVGKMLARTLKAVDKEPLKTTGQVRWDVKVRFARLTLKDRGLISKYSESGTWTLTDAGKRWAADPKLTELPAKPIPEPLPTQQELFNP